MFLLVADLGQNRVAGFFSNVVKGVEDYAYEWVRWPAVQIYWKLIRRGCNVDDVKTMIAECFDPAETIHIPSSRWSKTYKRAIVDTTSNFDLKAMLGMSGTVDFSKGLSNEERKERSRKKGIVFGALGSDDFAAPDMSEEVSIKTTNPNKKKPSRNVQFLLPSNAAIVLARINSYVALQIDCWKLCSPCFQNPHIYYLRLFVPFDLCPQKHESGRTTSFSFLSHFSISIIVLAVILQRVINYV